MVSRKPITPSTRLSSRKVTPNPFKVCKAKAQKPCKQIFKGLTFSFSDNFGTKSHCKDMIRWIKFEGGTYERVVNNETTHLVCTIDDYKKKTKQVRMALVAGPACVLVVPDYINDCLMKIPKRLMNEAPYTLSRVMKRVDQSKDTERKYIEDFKAGVKANKELVDNELYHVYYDQTGFEYKAVCVRPNDDGIAKQEKYTIYLFESHAKPNLYMAGARFSRGPGRPIIYWRDECHPKRFNDAFADFKAFFRSKTGIKWDDHCDKLPQDFNKFKYFAPMLGRPVGLLPAEKVQPTFPKANEVNNEDTEMTNIPEVLIYNTDSEVEEDSSTSMDSPSSSAVFRSRTPTSNSSDSGF